MNKALLSAAAGASVRIPKAACQLRDTDQVQLQQDAEAKTNGFTMVAITGKPLQHWYFGTLAIDLSGVQFKQRLPALLDHSTQQRVGYTTSITRDEKRGLLAEGKFLQRSEHAQAILQDGQDGFPWQASTYLQAAVVERLAENQVAEVNGAKLKGPAIVFRKSTLREVTFCALGVDDDTSAIPLSDTDAGEEIAVQLMQTEIEPMTPTNAPSGDSKDAAALAAQNEAAMKNAAEQARKDERDRVVAIRSNAAPEQAELADKLIAEGKSLSDALLALNQDLRARLAGTAPKPTKPMGKGNKADVATTGDTGDDGTEGLEDAELSDADRETRWRKQWDKDAKLRAEFFGNVEVFLAFKKNENRCTDFTSVRAFSDAQGEDHNND